MTQELLKAVDDLFRAYRENDPLMIHQTRSNLKWWWSMERIKAYRPQVTRQ